MPITQLSVYVLAETQGTSYRETNNDVRAHLFQLHRHRSVALRVRLLNVPQRVVMTALHGRPLVQLHQALRTVHKR